MSSGPVSTGIKKSPAWIFMEKQADGSVICLICKIRLKQSKNTSNMLAHLKTKHPFEFGDLASSPAQTTTLKKESKKPSASAIQPNLVETIDRQFQYKPIGLPRKELLDRDVLFLVVQDLQPFSVVEDKGFRRLVEDLDPQYELPTRKEIKNTLLPDVFDETKSKIIHELCEVSVIALSTDLWNSQGMQSFMTITAHFINQAWEQKSYVLETPSFPVSHTAENIAEELTRVMEEWQISTKVTAVVIDNAASVVADAVRQLDLEHITCFAHTLNGVVDNATSAVKLFGDIKDKVKGIVTEFHSSVKLTNTLGELQLQSGKGQRRLIQDVDTKWISTFYMLQRYLQEMEFVTVSLCIANQKEMCLSDEENELVKMTVQALEPFEAVTRELCEEKFTPLSKVLPLVHSLTTYCSNCQVLESNLLIPELLHQLVYRFPTLENNSLATMSTFLDPRFKKFAFQSEEIVADIENQLSDRMHDRVRDPIEPMSSPESTETFGLWAAFDKKIESQIQATEQTATRPNIELKRFNEEPPIRRNSDPLGWWKENSPMLPELSVSAKQLLSIPATSVPADRLFSKAGELVSQRRSCLKAKNINQVLFLNKNIDY